MTIRKQKHSRLFPLRIYKKQINSYFFKRLSHSKINSFCRLDFKDITR